MPTQPVIEKLEELRKELDKASTAVKHIDDAAEVAKTAATILMRFIALLNDLKALEEKHRQELVKIHKDKIDALVEQLQSLLTELKEKSKQLDLLIVETKNLEKTISDYYTEIKKINFPERLDKIDNQISAINIGIANLQTAVQETQRRIETGFKTTSESIQQSREKLFSDLTSHINFKISEQNVLLQKEIKKNRIIEISIGAILIIGIVIILILCHN
jgi:chromosome segregation ATPase